MDFEDTHPTEPMRLGPREGHHVPQPRGLGFFVIATIVVAACAVAAIFI